MKSNPDKATNIHSTHLNFHSFLAFTSSNSTYFIWITDKENPSISEAFTLAVSFEHFSMKNRLINTKLLSWNLSILFDWTNTLCLHTAMKTNQIISRYNFSYKNILISYQSVLFAFAYLMAILVFYRCCLFHRSYTVLKIQSHGIKSNRSTFW